MSDNFIFSSESVTEGHPDKVADQISDSVLDALLEHDPMSRVACEVLVSTGFAVIAGEISTKAVIDIQKIARETINGIGYTSADYGFDGNSCAVFTAIDELHPTFKDKLLKELGNFTEDQKRVCYLMRIGLSKPQIQNMTNLARVTIWRWTKKYDWVYYSGDN